MTDPIEILRELVTTAEALREWVKAVPQDTPLPTMPGYDGDAIAASIDAARSLLASPPAPAAQPAVPVQGEPVAMVYTGIYGDASVQWITKPNELPPGTKLYTRPAPTAAVRLTPEKVRAMHRHDQGPFHPSLGYWDGYNGAIEEVARAIESALSVRPSNDIADDIPGSTAAGGRVLATDALPEGWRLVPIEPTTEMCLADWNVSMSDAHTETGVSACAWAAMLAAAPEYVPEDEDGVKENGNG